MIDLLLLFQILFGLAFFIIICYFFFELHYFGRSLLSVVLAKFKKRIHILDETNVRGVCLTTDIDTLLTHMNNARFLRELDFAKIDFFERSGLLRLIKKHKGTICLGGTTVRYRRYLRLFSFYKIVSKVIYWDNASIYMEHRFVSLSDNFVNAIILCRTRIAHCDVEALMQDALQVPENGDIENAKKEKPEITPALQKWIEYNEISSALLRNTENVTFNHEDTEKKQNGKAHLKEVNGNTDMIVEENKEKAVDVVGITNPTFTDQT